MKYIALLFLFASCEYGASLPVSDVKVNPCVDSELYFLRYYQPYALDERKYIQCDPWGGMVVRDCYSNAKWSSWLGRCSDGVLERSFGNMSVVNVSVESLPTLPPISALPVNVSSCQYFGNETCINGGLCNFYPSGSRCVCIGNYSGDYCQTFNVKSFGIFGQLINESFSLDMYRKSRPLMDEFYVYNGTIDTSMVAENVTRAFIAEYLALYPNGTMRFDMLVNYLIQDYLSLIYPWQFFLQEFGYQSEMQMGYVNAIPGLLLSSKYSYDKYNDMWALYDDVLHRLVKYLPDYLPNIHKEAELFYQIYDGIFTEFERSGKLSSLMSNYTSEFGNVSYVTVEMIRDKIRRDFNQTLSLSYKLFDLLGRFDEEIGVRAAAASSSSSLNATFIQEVVANFSLSENVTRSIAALSESNAEIWDSLSFYGFWYVVSEFVSDDLLNSTRNSTFFLNGSAIARLVRPSRPNGVFRENSFADSVPVFQALVAENVSIAVQPNEPEKLFSEFNSTFVKSEKLVNGTFVSDKFVGELNDTVARPEKLFGESNVTVIGKPEKIIGELNVTQVAKPEKFMSFNESEPEKLVSGFNVSAVIPEKLIVREVFNASAPEKLVSGFNVSAVVPEKLVGEVNGTFVFPEKLVANSSLVPEKFVGDLNVTVGKPEKLVGEPFNVTVAKPEKFMSFNSTVGTERLVGEFDDEETRETSDPESLPERLVSFESTTVMPVPEKLVGDEVKRIL